jgi:hypothetical protein
VLKIAQELLAARYALGPVFADVLPKRLAGHPKEVLAVSVFRPAVFASHFKTTILSQVFAKITPLPDGSLTSVGDAANAEDRTDDEDGANPEVIIRCIFSIRSIVSILSIVSICCSFSIHSIFIIGSIFIVPCIFSG